jgi:2-haloacid dehalogenase
MRAKVASAGSMKLGHWGTSFPHTRLITLSAVRRPRAPRVHAVVFDVGGVLIDWDPRYLYRKIIPGEEQMEHFLAHVCTPEWHAQHDLGVPYEETIPALIAAHPQWADEIRAWDKRFVEMYGGPFDGTISLLSQLRSRRVPLLASTNWGAESWVVAKSRYEFLGWFDGALVSGEVGMAKPDPAFYELLVRTFGLIPDQTLYIEDNQANLRAAADRGFVPHRFQSAAGLEIDLRRHGLIGTGSH